ncbi:MAG: hypothetical protein AAF542_12965 [Pseudomonadota bacterium]
MRKKQAISATSGASSSRKRLLHLGHIGIDREVSRRLARWKLAHHNLPFSIFLLGWNKQAQIVAKQTRVQA